MCVCISSVSGAEVRLVVCSRRCWVKDYDGPDQGAGKGVGMYGVCGLELELDSMRRGKESVGARNVKPEQPAGP